MSYDADSFKAGFALGRILWRPPGIIPHVLPDIGWTASPKLIIDDSEKIFATAPGSTGISALQEEALPGAASQQ